MSEDAAFLAVDWGTTNRRIYLIENNVVARTERDDRGVRQVDDFAVSVAAIRDRFGDLPMLLAGMIGSTIGWQEAAYVSAPAGITDLAANLLWIDAQTAIVPGVSISAAGCTDVMRGEEVQLLGAAVAGLVPADAMLVQPGTHCKWVNLRGGRIVDFTTAMTGELFGLLKTHSVLATQLAGDVSVGPPFLAGVTEAKRRDLTAALFGIRAAHLLGTRADEDAAAYASGLLIGSDVVARLAETSDDTIHILAGPELADLYVAAIEAQGRAAVVIDSHAAFVAGANAIESESR